MNEVTMELYKYLLHAGNRFQISPLQLEADNDNIFLF